MNKSVKSIGHEVRGILADMSTAQIHPSTLQRPERGSTAKLYMFHIVHRGLYGSGKLANRNYVRKVPSWPFDYEPMNVAVVSYGQEKIVYRIRFGSHRPDKVLSIYHRESLLQNPAAVVEKKRDRYEQYKQYFGNLVLPTSFMVVDSPWGGSGKAAYIQPYIEDLQPFGGYTADKLLAKARKDSRFDTTLRTLVQGYRKMQADHLVPDLAESNIVIAASNIPIFDTGKIYSLDRLEQLRAIHPNYVLIEEIADKLSAIAAEK